MTDPVNIPIIKSRLKQVEIPSDWIVMDRDIAAAESNDASFHVLISTHFIYIQSDDSVITWVVPRFRSSHILGGSFFILKN